MSRLHFTDFTITNAYVSAVTVAHECDRRNAQRDPASDEDHRRPRRLSGMVRRMAVALSERCASARRLVSPQA
jgi:hypothetical protein